MDKTKGVVYLLDEMQGKRGVISDVQRALESRGR
jgi:hypothetical protein